MIDNAYSALAQLYEKIIVCDYEQWSQYLYNTAKTYLKSGATGIDAGCGTGYFTRLFSSMGYKMSGFDKSAQMLTFAQEKSTQENQNPIFYTIQDAKSFKTQTKVEFVSAINDVVNYLDANGVKRFFKSAYRALQNGGMLIFDISSPYKLQNTLANNTFFEDCADYAYIWYNKLHKDCVIMELSIFIRQGDVFKKFEERHTQYIHSPNFILLALEEAGFNLVACQDFLTTKTPKEDSQRIFFIAKKVV